jgi:hypothetical protein
MPEQQPAAATGHRATGLEEHELPGPEIHHRSEEPLSRQGSVSSSPTHSGRRNEEENVENPMVKNKNPFQKRKMRDN